MKLMSAFLWSVLFLIVLFPCANARVPVCASSPSSTDGDCYPLVHKQYGMPKPTEETCQAQGCCWRGEGAGTPSCTFPTATTPDQAQCDVVTDGLRIPCYSSKLYQDPDQATCEARGCCFRTPVPGPPGTPELPACFFPSQTRLYSLDPSSHTPSPDGSGFTATIALGAGMRGPFNTSAARLTLTVIFVDQSTVRVTIRDADNTRWEVPDIVTDRARVGTSSAAAADYTVSYTHAPFGIKISRKSTGDVLFDSTPQGNIESAGLVFENQFLQLSTSLGDATPHIYGLGEHISSFELPTTPWQRFTTYATYGFAFTPHEQQGGNPSIGVHPFYMQILSSSRQAHGVFLLNSNPAELILQAGQSNGYGEDPESASLTYRTNGGVLDFFVMLGPTPSAIVEQYTTLIGRPFLVPYWSLGFHLCRYGYNTLANTKAVVTSMKSRNVPHDTQWNDIDHMYKQMDFTTSPERYPMDELAKFVDELHKDGMRYVVIVDPAPAVDMSAPAAAKPRGAGSPYEPGVSLLQSGAYLHRSDGTPMLGVVWPNANVSFPDFLNPDAVTWWGEQIRAFRDRVDFDGKWIDMNEPQNFCYGGEQPFACRHIAGFTEHFNEHVNENGQSLGWYTFTPNNFTREDPSVSSCAEAPRGQGTAPPQPVLAGADYTGGLLYNALRNTSYSKQIGVLPPFDAMRQPWLPGQMAFPTGVNPQGAINMVCAGISYNLPAASAQQQPTLRYNAHSLYGWSEAKATFQGLLATRPGKRPFVLSRNTFPGSGRWAGHWLGDNTASWENLRQATAGLMMMGLFGIPMVGTDICGFFGVTTPQLCIRWQQAGAFYPFSRNHNVRSGPAPPGASETYANEMYEPPPAGPAPYPSTPFIPPQAPSQFLANETALMRDALLTRYAMMPYLYTNMVSGAHMRGTPLLRPMLFEFPHDANTYSLGCRNNSWRAQDCKGLQWMLGDTVLVTPVLEKDAESVRAYFPNLADGGTVRNGGWYDILSGLPLSSAVRNSSPDPTVPITQNWTTLSAPITRVPVHVRAGRILPLQDPCHIVGTPQQAVPFAPRNVPDCATTTTAARQHDFSLIVATNGLDTTTGSLFWDDGDAIDSVSARQFVNVSFTSYCDNPRCLSGTLRCNIEYADKSIALPPPLTKLILYGVAPASPNQEFCLSDTAGTLTLNATHSSVVFTGLQLNLADGFSVSWSGSSCPESNDNNTALIVGLCVGCIAWFAGVLFFVQRRQRSFRRRRAMLAGNAASFDDQVDGHTVARVSSSGATHTPTPGYTPPGYTDTGAGSLRASHSAL